MSNPTCLPKTTLKHYMAGWIDAEESSVIEAHLTACEICEQTLAQLESDPETLLEFLQQQKQPEISTDDPVVSYALARAKQLGSDPILGAEMIEPEPSISLQSLGPYDLLRPIGQGSMGRVYLAKHRQLGKQVAIKLFASRAFRSDEYVRRFEREVRAAGALQHPAIINATDAGQVDTGQVETGQVESGRVDTVHYLVMEYIEGLDLSRLARAVGRISIADVCEIGRCMALGLDHAHAAGIVHRDIKPSNVMLSVTGQVKLLDFGLAQTTLWDEASAELTTVGQLMGTIDYMAPEQAERADSVDYRADLYALGATLFRLLTGRAPLAASPNLSPLARLRLLATSTPPALRTLRPDASADLEYLIHQLLSRSPDERPASAAHVAEQLSRLASDADLPALLQRAQQANAVATTNAISDASAPLSKRVSQSDLAPPTNRIGRWLMTAAAGAFFLAATVLITLETQKGQVVIESIDANVLVELSQDGHVQKSVTVVPGANSTRIAAGQYTVSIAAGSDQFTLDHETIEIKRGQTVIARVRQTPKPSRTIEPSTSNVSSSVPEESDTDTKVYEGKSLATWRKELARERSLDGITSALIAVEALIETKDRADFVRDFLQDLPVHITGDSLSDILQKLASISGDTQAYLGHVIDVLPKIEDDKAILLISTANRLRPVSQSSDQPSPNDPNRYAPLANWAADFLLKENTRSDIPTPIRRNLIRTAAFEIVSHLVNMRSSKVKHADIETKFVKVLTSSKFLDESFWSQIVPIKENPLPVSLAIEVENHAVATFLESTDAIEFASATLQLSRLLDKSYDRTEMPPFSKSAEVIETIRKHLEVYIHDPNSIREFVDVRNSTLVDLPSLSVSPRLVKSVTMRMNYAYRTNNCMNLLQLISNLEAGNALAKELDQLMEVVKPAAISIAAQFQSGVSDVSIAWPDLTISSRTFGAFGDGRVSPPTASTEEVLHLCVFSKTETLLSPEKRSTLSRELPNAVIQKWVDLKLKQYDLDGDGQLNANEFSNRKYDLNGDKILTREELTTYIENALLNSGDGSFQGGRGAMQSK